jgi:hypothetical protein
MARSSREESGLDTREFMRGKECLSLIGGGSEAWERPVEISPGIDSEKFAGAEDGVEDGGPVAGIGMADEKPISQVMRSYA